MRNRGRIDIYPLDSDILWQAHLPRVPPSLEALALIKIDDAAQRPDAVLARVRISSALVAWQAGGAIINLHQRKAQAALAWLEANPQPPQSLDTEASRKDEIATMLKEWRAQADMTQARAAEVLGIPKRTYEGIETGKGFAYPQLLVLALMAFNRPPNPQG